MIGISPNGSLYKMVLVVKWSICIVQWTPSNPATLGTSIRVVFRGVAFFSMVDFRYIVHIGRFQI